MSNNQETPQTAGFGLIREAAFIDGLWVSGGGKNWLDVHNPHSLELIGRIPDQGRAETEAAIDAASNAFSDWSASTACHRADLLMKWHNSVLKKKQELAALLTLEQGKPFQEAQDEIDYAAGFLRWFAEEAPRQYGDIVPAKFDGTRVLVQKKPVGVVAAITPWNFPAAMVTRKVGAALAAGCTVVLKPSELTPFTALALAELAYDVGIPSGVFNVITGAPQEIGAALTSDFRVRKLTFTGSSAVGKLLAEQCAPTLKKVSLELGGNAAFIVFEDADIELAVEAVIQSKFRNTGQTCVCPNRILVHERVLAPFTQLLQSKVEQLVVGSGFSEHVNQGPLIDQRALEKLETLVSNALVQGATLTTGGQRLPQNGAGYYYAPTILTGVSADMRLFQEEIFGPVAAISSFQDDDEAVKIANSVSTGLAAYIATTSTHRIFNLSEKLDVGMVGVNTGKISDPSYPFGGIKESGYGVEGSKYGIQEYLTTRTVAIGGL